MPPLGLSDRHFRGILACTPALYDARGSRGCPAFSATFCCADFLEMHPGGAQRLMLAAGGAIDPFWAMYAQHNTAEVRQMLEGYRIGDLVRTICLPVLIELEAAFAMSSSRMAKK